MDETSWTRVAAASALAPGQPLRIEHEGRAIALFKLADGRIHALNDACPHAGFPLSESTVEGDQVTCMLHHWVFALEDGRCRFGARDAHSYPIRVEGDDVFIAPVTAPRAEQTRLMTAIAAAIASGATGELEELVEQALEKEVELDALLALGREATVAVLVPAQEALRQSRISFPTLPHGDLALAALSIAARPRQPGLAVIPPLAAPDVDDRLVAEEPRHLRRRLRACLERHDAREAGAVVVSYLHAGRNPRYLAEDLMRAALEHHPANLPEALRVASRAYCWPAEGDPALFRLVATLASPYVPDAHPA